MGIANLYAGLKSAVSGLVGRNIAAGGSGFDITKTTRENQRHWDDTSSASGRSVYTHQDRKIARERSRLEASNNSWYSGMLRTSGNHIVGKGPRLQVLTPDNDRNSRIEKRWRKWNRSTNFVNRLRMGCETYWRDGACFIMRSSRPSLGDVSLDVRFYEAEQCGNPLNMGLDPSVEDGIRLDANGNPVEYFFYDRHPGDMIGIGNPLEGRWYKADDVIHLFRPERPGQVHGWPRCAPALEHLAHMRRFSKATLSSAEQVAVNSLFMKTNASASALKVAKMPKDWLTTDYERGALNFMPEGWEPYQLESKHPGTSNESYQRTELTYFTRCSGQPYSLAAGTSRDSNFASAKMDLKNTWEPEVQSDQSIIEIVVMDRIWMWFLEDIAISTDILDGLEMMLDEIEYQFHWPPLPVADEGEVADARSTRLSTGQSTFSSEATAQGLDDDALVEAAARDNGVTPEQYRADRYAKTFGIAAPANPTSQAAQAMSDAAKKISRTVRNSEPPVKELQNA